MSPNGKTLESRVEEVHGIVIDIHKRLFVDNGKPCHQTRLDRVERVVGFALVVLTAVVLALINKVVGK